MADEPRHCPYAAPACILVSRYDVTPPPYALVEAIVTNVEDDDVAAALEAVSGKTYRGESCQRCGAFFPAEGQSRAVSD